VDQAKVFVVDTYCPEKDNCVNVKFGTAVCEPALAYPGGTLGGIEPVTFYCGYNSNVPSR
jgi:hypothetical protein